MGILRDLRGFQWILEAFQETSEGLQEISDCFRCVPMGLREFHESFKGSDVSEGLRVFLGVPVDLTGVSGSSRGDFMES